MVRASRGRKDAEVDLVEIVDDAVVEEDVGAVQAGDHHVFVVAGITQERPVGAVAVLNTGHVLVDPARTDLELGPNRPIRVRHVEVGPSTRTAAEHRIEVERGCPGVG